MGTLLRTGKVFCAVSLLAFGPGCASRSQAEEPVPGAAGPGPAAQSQPARAKFPELKFSKDFAPGSQDRDGNYLGGTETMRLIVHGGKLFAGMGYWSDEPGKDPKPGAQVLRKDSAGGAWAVDVSFGPHYLRVEGMFDLTLTTDAQGQPLKPAVNLLLAGPSDVSRDDDTAVTAWVRNDESGKWTKSEIAHRGGGVRSFAAHVDKVTKVHGVFAGTNRGSIYRGGYSPDAPGGFKWGGSPELAGTGRVMCFAECNGDLYAACGLKDESQPSGGLFRRVDGEKPRWEQVYRWPYQAMDHGDELKIMRGLTSVPAARDADRDVLIGTRTYQGVVERIDPGKDHAASVELDIKGFVAKAWGIGKYDGVCLSAYNRLVPFANPLTGEKLHLIGLCVRHPGALAAPNNGAYFLVRHLDGSYELGGVYDPANPVPAGQSLRAVRTICVSPFPEDQGRVLYFGGYDAYGGPHHNTAWIYKASFPKNSEPDKQQ
jgi:hypothetical protein